MRTFTNNFYQERDTRDFARTNFSRVYGVGRNGVRGGGAVAEPKNNMIFLSVIAVLAVLVLGVFSLVLGAQVSKFDYEISEQEQVISDLTQRRAELVLENARSASLNAVHNSELANYMSSR